MALPIAITGLGALSSVGAASALTRALIAGQDGLTRPALARLPLSDRLPVGVVSAPLAAGRPRTVGLALAAAHEALADAAWSQTTDLGLILGSCTGGMPEGESAYFAGRPAHHRDYHRQPIGTTLAMLADDLGIVGPRAAHAEACASSACALAEACGWIRTGLAEAVLVVGADALCRMTMAGFNSLQVVDAAGCRPLTEERAGMNLGEGACALVLEHPRHARRRGATIKASLLGWGLSADGHHATAPNPDGVWLESAIQAALADAGIPAREVAFAAMHGTGTRDNDIQEAGVLGRLFGHLPASSHKRTIGHTLGAAGAFGAFAAITAIRNQLLLPTAGLADGTPLAAIAPVSTARPGPVPVALVTCLAFGGVNGALLFGEAHRCD